MKYLSALIFAVFCFSVPVLAAERPDIVEIVDVSGEINAFTVSLIGKQIEGINDNKNVKGVLLSVNTPGGGAVASAALYEEIAKLRVPVVGWCSYVCASGGMYALMSPSVKYIGARTGTVAGSIGVLLQITRYGRLLEWAKIDSETYASGLLKASGDPAKTPSEAEKKYLIGIVEQLAERFYSIVDKARGAKIKNWGEVKTGRVFIGDAAVTVGLIDEIMERDAAIKKVKELSGSKLIFTRDELRKMSKQAEEQASYSAPLIAHVVDLQWLVEQLKEIRAGESVAFKYLMPLRF